MDTKICFSLLMIIALLSAGCMSGGKKRHGRRYALRQDTAPRSIPNNLLAIPDAVPKVEPKSRIGNPKKYTVFNKTYYTLPSSRGYRARGLASWYGKKFHGHKTSSGSTYNMFAMTAAHKTLPLPTYLTVKNLDNGRKVIVKVTDRGPFHQNRLIDLSYTAAKKLGILKRGTGRVEITAIDPVAFQAKNQQNNRPALKFAKREPAPVEAETTPKQTYLQLGAFANKANARSLVQRVRDKLDLGAFIHETQGKKKTLFLVNIGPLKVSENISHLTNKIKSANLPSPIKILR